MQPVVVRSSGEFLKLLGGNRRYHTCRSLRRRKIVCNIVELNDREPFQVSIIENLQRKTLNPIDEASLFKAYFSDFGWGIISELAEKISRSASYVTKCIKLLDLSDALLDSTINSKIDTSTEEELSSLKTRLNNPSLDNSYVKEVIFEKCTCIGKNA